MVQFLAAPWPGVLIWNIGCKFILLGRSDSLLIVYWNKSYVSDDLHFKTLTAQRKLVCIAFLVVQFVRAENVKHKWLKKKSQWIVELCKTITLKLQSDMLNGTIIEFWLCFEVEKQFTYKYMSVLKKFFFYTRLKYIRFSKDPIIKLQLIKAVRQ